MPNPFMSSPFRQFGAQNVIAASTTSATAVLARAADQTCVVTNPAANAVAFVKFGAGSQTATSADAAVSPGTSRVFGLLAADTNVGVLLAASTGTVYVGVGDGNIT
jgi:hypothetical protein